MSKGYLAFVLHAHLPFVRHPEYDDFLEERWLFEAITETYIPLIKFFRKAAGEKVPFQVTVSISPSLLAMLEDELLQERYDRHLGKLIALSEQEQQRNQHQPHFQWLAGVYRNLFQEARDIFNKHDRRLSVAFKHLHDSGSVELITTAATHGFLPLLSAQPKAVEAQVITGLNYFESVFGFRPKGMWLPECAYYPGVDEILRREGVRFFFMESIGIDHASITPFYGVHTPIYTPSGVAAFGRDQGSTKQVWSAKEGFPGDPNYREFYRDIGQDLDFNYIQPYIGGGVRADTGIKYYRITGPTSWKEPYNPDVARERAAAHAEDFLRKRIAHIEYLSSVMEIKPIILAPFDAELFGHWWFEGPQWLDFVIRKAGYDQQTIELTTLSNYLDHHPVHQTGTPCTSTWGHKGYFETWLNNKTDWIYAQLMECGHRMERLANQQDGAAAKKAAAKGIPADLIERALNQCLRELLLAQSSDWPFIISNGTSEQYASRRVKDHVSRFHYLADAVEQNNINQDALAVIEEMDNIFPNVDYRVFRSEA